MVVVLRLKKAFTLSEVLITLGIIGVVAALTIPALIKSFQEQALLTQFQNAQSTLYQAYLRAFQDNGVASIDTNGIWSAQDAYNYMKPFLNVSQDCSYDTPCDRGNLKTLDGVVWNSSQWSSYHLVLNNGMNLKFYDWGGGNGGVVVFVDTNGNKPPNQWGYDFFMLQLSSKNNSPFISWYSPSWTINTSTYCKKSIVSAGWPNGSSCAYWVIRHGNMDYLYRDVSDTEWAN